MPLYAFIMYYSIDINVTVSYEIWISKYVHNTIITIFLIYYISKNENLENRILKQRWGYFL